MANDVPKMFPKWALPNCTQPVRSAATAVAVSLKKMKWQIVMFGAGDETRQLAKDECRIS